MKYIMIVVLLIYIEYAAMIPCSLVDLPSAPRDVKLVSSTPQSIRITWTAPLEPGRSVITDYLMELYHPNNTITTRNYTLLSPRNPQLGYTFTYLYASQTYGIQIAAYNAVGMGARSARKNYKTAYYSGIYVKFHFNFLIFDLFETLHCECMF